jgi:hypothetical protein
MLAGGEPAEPRGGIFGGKGGMPFGIGGGKGIPGGSGGIPLPPGIGGIPGGSPGGSPGGIGGIPVKAQLATCIKVLEDLEWLGYTYLEIRSEEILVVHPCRPERFVVTSGCSRSVLRPRSCW